MNNQAVINLTGVPETMLWTLHNRASAALRPDGILRDPDCLRIYQSIAYDFERSFGKPDGSHAKRSLIFDRAVTAWMLHHPGGTVVELACGLETQFQRLDNGKVNWLCVDLPDAIVVRERFLQPTDRCRHLPISALDFSWMDKVDPAQGVFVTAQGLLMYFEEKEVRQMLITLFKRFPDLEVMFDTIPRWFSRKTMQGMKKTPHYTTPKMPWGINRNEIREFCLSCSGKSSSITDVSYGYIPGLGLKGIAFYLFSVLPFLSTITPTIVHLKNTEKNRTATQSRQKT